MYLYLHNCWDIVGGGVGGAGRSFCCVRRSEIISPAASVDLAQHCPMWYAVVGAMYRNPPSAILYSGTEKYIRSHLTSSWQLLHVVHQKANFGFAIGDVCCSRLICVSVMLDVLGL